MVIDKWMGHFESAGSIPIANACVCCRITVAHVFFHLLLFPPYDIEALANAQEVTQIPDARLVF